eukprot:m.360926 g.360926  ORF g.360926 m.360926 type:complete len:269 (-) comp16644_c0_seq32:682-1488(-)
MSRCRVDTTCTGCALRSRSRAMDAALTSVGGIQPTWNSGTSMANSRSWSAIEKNECLLAVQELLLPDCDICDHVLHDDDKYVMPCGCQFFHRACVEDHVKISLQCPTCVRPWKSDDILNPIKEDEFDSYQIHTLADSEIRTAFQTYQERFEELKDDPFDGVFGRIYVGLKGTKNVEDHAQITMFDEFNVKRRWCELEMSYPLYPQRSTMVKSRHSTSDFSGDTFQILTGRRVRHHLMKLSRTRTMVRESCTHHRQWRCAKWRMASTIW